MKSLHTRLIELLTEDDVHDAVSSQLVRTHQKRCALLSSELHDHLAQLIIASQLKLASALNQQELDRARPALLEADDLLDEAFAFTRDLMTELKSEAEPRTAFPGCLASFRGRFRPTGLLVSVQIEAAPLEVDEGSAQLLFEATRELLANAARHAGVETASVEVRSTDRALEIEVADKGKGFDARAEMPYRRGLKVVSENCSALGGALKVSAALGSGTRALLTIPVTKNKRAPLPRARSLDS